MINSLSTQLDDFPGAANQTRCFAHTVSISAKAIIQQFDAPKSKNGDDAAEALAGLYEGLEVEEREEREERQHNDEEDEDEPLCPWEDYREGLREDQREKLDASVQPVKSTLAKVVDLLVYPNPTLTNKSYDL
jgi:hypothetical protein